MLGKKKNILYISTEKNNQKVIAENEPYLFEYLDFIKYIDVKNLDTSRMKTMEGMFYKCFNLVTIKGMEYWDTSNVINMSSMFCVGDNYKGNGNLKNIDVSNFITTKVKDMSDMFYGCGKLLYIDVSKWDVSSVKTFDHMFADNFNLKWLDVSKWNTKSCINYNAMFNDCHSLEYLPVENWDVCKARYLSQLFERCLSLKELDLSKWQTPNCIGFSEMFNGCSNLKTLNISSLNTKFVPDKTIQGKGEYFRCSSGMEKMFANCIHLQSINFSKNYIVKDKAATDIYLNINKDLIL